jgi:Domain of unknown function (DUF6532)
MVEPDNLQDPDTNAGLFEHPILQDVINEQWFGNKKADGINFSTYFNLIPDATIALVFTVVCHSVIIFCESHFGLQVEYAISQWTSGQLVKTSQFTEVAYHDVYKCHLSSLEAWNALSSLSARALASHKACLYNHGWCVDVFILIALTIYAHSQSSVQYSCRVSPRHGRIQALCHGRETGSCGSGNSR